MSNPANTIAIIGGGMAGLSCAAALAKAGHSPVIFDKGRGPGGRMAARRAEVAGETVSFDHGAQFFTADTPEFAEQITAWESSGLVELWSAAGDKSYVGVPGMNGPIRGMADALDVRWGARVSQAERQADGTWRLSFEGSSETQHFTQVICAIPAEQAAVLLAMSAPDYAAQAKGITSTPCWALMAAFAGPLNLPDAVKGGPSDPIAWAARNSAKPERSGSECWVIHGSADFSQSIIDHSKEDAADALLEAFAAQTGTDLTETVHTAAHRWLFAFPEVTNPQSHLWDERAQLGVCGDWLAGPRVEDAFLSGSALAAAILNSQ
ncbi:MAG: FAD-dependent oxidoreductase [Erythrobacter sp.]